MSSAIKSLHQQLVKREITCQALVEKHLKTLKENTHHTVNLLLEKQALDKAKKVDQKINSGQSIGLLEGIPFGVKDVFMLIDTFTTASSDLLKQYNAPYTATAIQKLLDAGAIPIVKENCDSFGHGSSSENTVFGAVKNAKDTSLVAGGSSGGSAVNVAKDYTVFSIGGDTGGSIRQPSGYNKIYGMKPSYGRVSRYGLMAYASSTDCVGPLTTSIEDLCIVLNAISGKDTKDQTSYSSDSIEFEDLSSQKIKKVGYYKDFIDNTAISDQVKKDFLQTLDKIKRLPDVELIAIEDFFPTDVLVATYYTIAMAETASNLSRLDGTNYGDRVSKDSLKETYSVTRSEKFSQETKRRIVGGNQILSQGFSDEVYTKALRLRDQLIAKFNQDFKDIEVIVSPLTPTSPPKIGKSLKDPLQMYLSDAYTVGFSLGKLPCVTIPQGTVTGVQITAPRKADAKALAFANVLKEVL